MEWFETAHNINNTFGSGTADGRTVQWWFKKFCRGDESLKDEEHSGQPLKLTKQLRGSSELILLQLHEKRLTNSASAIQQSLGIWSKLERWKSSVSRCLMSWPQIKNIVFSYSTQKQLIISRLDCDVLNEWILCDNQRWPAQLLNQEEAPKHFPKPTCTKKGHGHCVLVCCPSDPLQLSESQRNCYIRDVCSANWRDAPKLHTCAGIAQQKGPDSWWQHSTAHCTTQLQKLSELGSSFASSITFIWPLANQRPCLQASQRLFAGNNAATTRRRQKTLSESSLNPEARILMLQE